MNLFKVLVFLFVYLFIGCKNNTNENWKPASNDLLTTYAAEVSSTTPWPEYPRPQLVRKEWMNLNGLWNYAISKGDDKPAEFDGKILVPYPVESALSGVVKRVSPHQTLWYERGFKLPKKYNGKEIMLHFGAVDWEMELFVNNEHIGSHRGGYTPFKFNITEHLKSGGNVLTVKVKDPTDTGWQPVGKQVLEPEGIFYTSVTGIWQTVWLEPLNDTHFEHIQLIPNLDRSTVSIKTNITDPANELKIKVEINDKKSQVYQGTFGHSEKVEISLNSPQKWSPESPFLYDVKLTLLNGEQVVDEVGTYFGMRKISVEKDINGTPRIFLNNQPYFQNGPLDQGYWPDGLYTPPTDDAMHDELWKVKEMGFNMLRKHVKVEPARFYHYCDKLGILVWQDMANGDKKIGWDDDDIVRTEESETQFRFELEEMISNLYNHPSIVMWVPFNEGWGQFKTAEITDFVKQLDPTRLINSASGWTDRGTGDIFDVHTYPAPVMPELEEERASVIGEFGGLGLPVEGHTWEQKNNWGYALIDSKDKLLDKYETYYNNVWEMKEAGLSAVVYTQLTDVETETNGLITYDRKIIKADMDELKAINTGSYIPSPDFATYEGLHQIGDSVVIFSNIPGQIHFTTDGSDPNLNTTKYQSPIAINKDMTIRARLAVNEELSRSKSIAIKTTTMPKPVYVHSPSSRYNGGGIYGLRDGIFGSNNFHDGKWQGFQKNDLNVTFDLSEKKKLSHLSLNCLSSNISWIFFPSEIEFLVSEDGLTFNSVEKIKTDVPASEQPTQIKSFSVDTELEDIRFVQVLAKTIGPLPDWHGGAGQPSYLFVDEVTIR